MTIEEIKFEDKVETEDWEQYVISEVKGLLDIYLPVSRSGHVGISYRRALEGTTEGGEPIFNERKVSGVSILLSFDFDGEVEKPI